MKEEEAVISLDLGVAAPRCHPRPRRSTQWHGLLALLCIIAQRSHHSCTNSPWLCHLKMFDRKLARSSPTKYKNLTIAGENALLQWRGMKIHVQSMTGWKI